jgi:hypothetical protein
VHHRPPPQPPYSGGYPTGYGPGPEPPRDRRRTAVVVSLVVALLAAGGIVAVVLLSGDGGTTNPPLAASSSTVSRLAGPPDRHTKLPGCREIATRVPGLPPLEESTATEGPKTSTYPELYVSCTFKSASATRGKADRVFEVDITAHLTDPRGYPTGTGEAASSFEAGLNNGNHEATGIGIGERAAWVRDAASRPDSALRDCPLVVLDGNVEFEVRRSGAADPAGQADPAGPGCRQPTQELATTIYQATLGGP